MGLLAASKAFFKLLFNKELSQSFEALLDGKMQPKIAEPTASPPKPEKKEPPKPVRSDAISLLSALQRESRLLDIVTEDLAAYSDAQVGAAARDVLKETGKVIERIFAPQPLTDQEDESTLTTPEKFDAAEFRLTGNVAGDPPYSGVVAHRGWKATQCEVPKWSGQAKSAMIIAPVELEIQ